MLAFFATLLIFISSLFVFGQEESDSSTTTSQDNLYELGVVLVQYDETTFQQARASAGGSESGSTSSPSSSQPIAVVNNFLTETPYNYNPQVIEVFEDLHAEAIHINTVTNDDSSITVLPVDPAPLLDGLMNLSGVVFAQPSFLYEFDQNPGQSPNNPELTAWHLEAIKAYVPNPPGDSTTINDAWDKVYSLANKTYVPKIGVIDSGIATGHPDFVDRIPNRRCEVPQYSMLNFRSTLTTTCSEGGYDFLDDDTDVDHEPGDLSFPPAHGTKVAGAAAATFDSNRSIGVAPFADIIPIRVGRTVSGGLSTRAILKAIDFAEANDIDIINMSFGSSGICSRSLYSPRPQDTGYLRFLEYQRINSFHGIAVASAGNRSRKTGTGNYLHIPADFNQTISSNRHHCNWNALGNLITVGGTEQSKDINGNGSESVVEKAVMAQEGTKEVRWVNENRTNSGSNYNNNTDITAPAHNVTVPSVTVTTNPTNGVQAIASYIKTTATGTSFAAPQVAGTLALMKRMNEGLTTDELKKRLLESADELISLVGPDCEPGTGDDYVKRGKRLNAYNAVLAALDTDYVAYEYRTKEIEDAEKTKCKMCVGGAQSWTVGNNICSANLPNTVAHGATGTLINTASAFVGSVTYSCNIGTLTFSNESCASCTNTCTYNTWTPAATSKCSGTIAQSRTNTTANACTGLTCTDTTRVVTATGTCGAGEQCNANGVCESVPTPINGVCNNTVQNACVTGTPNDNAVADTNTYYRWRCDGLNGGANSGTCQKLIPVVNCTTPLSTLSTTATQEGTWASGCASVSRSGKYAQYYTFTLSAEKEVTIDLVSSQDAYLYLHTYSATAANHVGSRITFDDDGGENRNARIIRTLSAGTYTIEATTYSDNVVGSFTLTVAPANTTPDPVIGQCNNTVQNACVTGTPNDNAVADTNTYYRWRCDGLNGGANSGTCQKLIPVVNCTTPLSTLSTTATQEGTWASGCASVSRSGKYAQYYTFTLSAEKEVTIDLVSSQDAYLYLHTYSATAANHVGSRITFDDDGGENRNARIIRTLSAGTYTIEATTYSDNVVGSFTLTVAPANTTPDPVIGQCNNTVQNACVTGTPNDNAVADTNTYYRWRCDGLNGGANSGTCQKQKGCPNTCTYGTWTPAATSKCSGTVAQSRTNTTANACTGLTCTDTTRVVTATGTCGTGEQCNANGVCEAAPTPINGVCGSARDTCTAGRYRNLRDSNSYYRWRCDGTNGGTNSRACLFEKCGSWSDTYCANDGRRLRQVRTCGSRTEYQTIQTCSNGCSGSACNPDPTNGVCGSARNTCTAGTPNDNAVTDTNTYYRWRCDGLNGGANSGTCQKQKGCTRHSQCSGSLYCSACNSSGNCTGTGTCQACTWGNLWCNAADTKVKQSCKVNGQGSSKRYRTVETCSSGTICDGGQCVAECLVNPCSANCRSSVTWGFCHNGHTHGGSGYVHNQRQRHGWYTCHGSTTKRWKSADC